MHKITTVDFILKMFYNMYTAGIKKIIFHYIRLALTYWRAVVLILCINVIYWKIMNQYAEYQNNLGKTVNISVMKYVIKERSKTYKVHEIPADIYEALFENKPWKFPFAKRKKRKKSTRSKIELKDEEIIDDEERIDKSKASAVKISFCEIPKPKIEIRDAEFQKVSESDVYVYSAFLDVRYPQPRTVKVIGISTVRPGPLFCQLYYPDGAVISSPATTIAADFVQKRHEPFKYKPHFYNCPETQNLSPVNVSLTTKACVGEVSNLLPLHFRDRLPEEKVANKILISVKTLHQFNTTYRLIEFIEFQRVMNASHVMFYGTDNVSLEVKNVLNYYIKSKFVSIRPWNMPVQSSRKYSEGIEIRTYGQHSQMHDCIYRYMNEYKYIIFIDKDEFIVPHIDALRTYQDVMQHLKYLIAERVKKLKEENKESVGMEGERISSFVISNAHFCTSQAQLASLSSTLLLPKVLVRAKPDMFKGKTKVIVNPRLVVTMAVHKVKIPLSVFMSQVLVPPSVVLLHHYRWQHNQTCNEKDNSAIRLTSDLIKNVNLVCEKLRLDPVSV